jgi:signal peptide peptidase SppA
MKYLQKILEISKKAYMQVCYFPKKIINNRVGRFFKTIVQLILCAVVFFLVFQFLGSLKIFAGNEKTSLHDSSSSNTDSADCSVVGINLHGTLLTYIPDHADNDQLFNYDVVSSENITGTIKTASDDPNIKAILIEVDSGGGSPVAGEEIANALKNSKKPTVALIRDVGASAAYWAVSSAGRIFASENSSVGSIGVTNSYLDNTAKDKKEGYEYISLTSGQFKDTGNPNKPITQADKDLMMRDVNIIYKNFMNVVSKNRNIPISKVQSFADGSTVLGVQAKKDGLIDEIGGMVEVEDYLEKTIGEKPDICW